MNEKPVRPAIQCATKKLQLLESLRAATAVVQFITLGYCVLGVLTRQQGPSDGYSPIALCVAVGSLILAMYLTARMYHMEIHRRSFKTDNQV